MFRKKTVFHSFKEVVEDLLCAGLWNTRTTQKPNDRSPVGKRRVEIQLAHTGTTVPVSVRQHQLGLVKIPAIPALKSFQYSTCR